MSDNQATLQCSLERCIVESNCEAWSWFLSVFGSLIQRVYHAHADARHFPEFEFWFPGWLFHERKLHAAYRGLRAKIESGECSTADSQEQYVANYVARIVRTAVAEFAQEGRLKAVELVSESRLDTFPLATPDGPQGLLNEVLEAMQHLIPELRIPFWLRYFAALGPLTATDAAWVANQAGLTVTHVAELVHQEAEANCGHQKPLSSEFIGSLLSIPPCADGRYSTVDQRVRRAILRIREHLAQSAEKKNQ